MQYIAIDIGASSGRHMFAKMDGGKLVLEEIYRFQNGAKRRDGHLVWDTENLFQEIVNGLKTAKELGKIPDCIGIDTWAVDYALLDENDEKIGEVYSYRDSRNEEGVAGVHEILPLATLYEKTGIQFQPFNTVYQLYADKITGKLGRAESMLMLPDYLNFLLTGVKRQEYTNATSTGIVNAITHTWDEEILETLGYPKKLFGELTQPASVVGQLKEEIQAIVGYNAVVMLPATHDTASAVLAAPLDEPTPYLSSGTWSLLGVEQERARTDNKSLQVNYSNEGSVDFTFRYQKNIMGLWMIQEVRKIVAPDKSFAEIADLARANPTACRVDVNDSRFLAPKNMSEEIDVAVGKKLSLGEKAYCIFASLAEGYKKAIEEMESLTGKRYDTLNIIGGGSKNTLLNELTAKATGKKIITGPTECSAIGNVIMQMLGQNELSSLQEARAIIKNSFEIREVSII